jgi:prepilin-type N-terminal cleavage/methylation domain-containing protein
VKKGFTLIELLLVVTILGILAAIAIPKLFPQTEKARVAEAIAILQSIRQGEQAYFLEQGVYLSCSNTIPGCWASLGMDDPNANSDYFSYSVMANNPPPRFLAQARRMGPQDPGAAYGGKLITLDHNGDYCVGLTLITNKHPFCPS